MSMRIKKASAFSVFKTRKATSLSDVEKANTVTPKERMGRSASASNSTPSNRDISIMSFNTSSHTDKKKTKNDLKMFKKLLKSGSKKRPSYMPDAAVQQSPLYMSKTDSNVELRSLRPKGSTTNVRYQLPLKATPDVTSASQQGSHESQPQRVRRPGTSGVNGVTTPPLPPRITRPRAGKVIENGGLQILTAERHAHKRSSISDTPPPQLPPRSGRQNISFNTSSSASASAGSSGPDEADSARSRPAKRRRLSQGSAPPSPQRSSTSSLFKHSSIVSPKGSRERVEPVPAHPREKRSSLPYMFDSLEEARRLFECLIHPVVPQKFFSELWEKKPLLVKRHQPDYNEGWFSTVDLDRILREESVKFTENIDIVTYENGKRETHNPDGRAYAPVVWDYYQNGCSVRLLNPQTYCRNVWKLLSILQEYFGCCAGANVYLTPPATQGFAPHYDDIEAFVLQLEGKKHWRLYSPRTENEHLAKYSSANFTDADIGEPILDVILEAGDLLYFPKGTIHQGRTLEDDHSLHITVSCCQKNSWGDLLEKVVPRALQIAFEEDVEFRKSLPRDYLGYMGVAFSDNDSVERKGFLRKVEQLMMKLLSYAPVDSACDQMGKEFIHDSLPPVLTEAEKQNSVHGHGERWDKRGGRVAGAVEMEPDTKIKLIRRGAIRLVTEDEKVSVYHSLENGRVYHSGDVQFLEVTPEMAPGVEFLLHSYPEYVSIDALPLDSLPERVELASGLYDRGLVITQEPLEHLSDTESEPDLCSTLKPQSSRQSSRQSSPASRKPPSPTASKLPSPSKGRHKKAS